MRTMEWLLWNEEGERECFRTEEMDKQALFEKIYDVVVEEGGDGDMAVVFSPETHCHREIANDFQVFLEEKDPGEWHRWNMRVGSDIHFSRDQERFTFANDDHFCEYGEQLTGFQPVSNKVVVYESL